MGLEKNKQVLSCAKLSYLKKNLKHAIGRPHKHAYEETHDHVNEETHEHVYKRIMSMLMEHPPTCV